MRIFSLLFSLLALPAAAHEFWLEPSAYQIAPDGTLQADIVNGQDFDGAKQVYFPGRFEIFAAFAGDLTENVAGRAGDRPALNRAPVAEGLNIVAYQARNATVSYETWEKFQSFVDHKDLGDVLPRHQARGLPEAGFDEVYSRYSKTLIGVGNSIGADRRTGLETEIVALTNPYTDDLSDGFSVQLFYRDDPRANVQVEVFEKYGTGEVTVTFYRTDASGIATFPVTAGHSYMVDAVVLREPDAALNAQTGAVWETLWANLTFGVPE
ncbi:Uncharacterized conserved protein, contains GH25 family domain [Yoonia tamlensis]|uniref:Uncharacterized conserved protein, contains GH25 family domain n=1 Tax=Yoonia tamlensis TaxID=390270 RepID=A0A1I6GBF4_9RHOB|nr:DUF4198 domain-containing protein [Yoonia tamlensis]SFR39516.1 Uncharacterized conserved protein, contains GH25 family domain [Yoonia tamlensis]